MCRYTPPGNTIGKFKDNVGKKSGASSDYDEDLDSDADFNDAYYYAYDYD